MSTTEGSSQKESERLLKLFDLKLDTLKEQIDLLKNFEMSLLKPVPEKIEPAKGDKREVKQDCFTSQFQERLYFFDSMVSTLSQIVSHLQSF